MGSFTSTIIKHFEEEYKFEEHYRNRPPIKPLEGLSHHQVKMNFHHQPQPLLHSHSRKNSLVSTSISSSNTSSSSSIVSSISNSTLKHSSSRMSKYFLSSDDSNHQQNSNIPSPGPTSNSTSIATSPTLRKSSKTDLYKKTLSPSSPTDVPIVDNALHSLQKQNSLPCLKPECKGLKEKTLTKSRSMREKGHKQIRFADEPQIMMERVASADSSAEMMFSSHNQAAALTVSRQ